MKKIFYLLLPFLLFSCTKESQSEIFAKSEITKFYGGTAEVKKITGTKDGKNISGYQIIISDSPLLNDDSDNSNFHAGNIAWLFYHNLGVDKNKYSPILVTEILKNNNQKVYNFTLAELHEIDKLTRQVEVINTFLIKNDTAGIVAQFDKKENISEQDLVDLLEEVYKNFGIINGVQFQGFAFEKDEGTGEIIDIKETLVMEKKNVALHLFFDRKSKKLISFLIP